MPSEIELVTQLITAKHEIVMERLTAQDQKLDTITKRTDGIEKQTKLTNGRVTDLETDRAIIADRGSRRSRTVQGGTIVGASIAGVIVGGLGHALHLW